MPAATTSPVRRANISAGYLLAANISMGKGDFWQSGEDRIQPY